MEYIDADLVICNLDDSDISEEKINELIDALIERAESLNMSLCRSFVLKDFDNE